MGLALRNDQHYIISGTDACASMSVNPQNEINNQQQPRVENQNVNEPTANNSAQQQPQQQNGNNMEDEIPNTTNNTQQSQVTTSQNSNGSNDPIINNYGQWVALQQSLPPRTTQNATRIQETIMNHYWEIETPRNGWCGYEALSIICSNLFGAHYSKELVYAELHDIGTDQVPNTSHLDSNYHMLADKAMALITKCDGVATIIGQFVEQMPNNLFIVFHQKDHYRLFLHEAATERYVNYNPQTKATLEPIRKQLNLS